MLLLLLLGGGAVVVGLECKRREVGKGEEVEQRRSERPLLPTAVHLACSQQRSTIIGARKGLRRLTIRLTARRATSAGARCPNTWPHLNISHFQFRNATYVSLHELLLFEQTRGAAAVPTNYEARDSERSERYSLFATTSPGSLAALTQPERTDSFIRNQRRFEVARCHV
jgi:hypothetical protein